MNKDLILKTKDFEVNGNYLINHKTKMIYNLDDEAKDKIIKYINTLNN